MTFSTLLLRLNNKYVIQGVDPAIPPYLRYEGKVRNLRLSRREISVIINDIWVGRQEHGQSMSMQDFVTKYFEDRYLFPVKQLGVFSAIRKFIQIHYLILDTNSRLFEQSGHTTYALAQNKCSTNPKSNCSGVSCMVTSASTSIGGSARNGRR